MKNLLMLLLVMAGVQAGAQTSFTGINISLPPRPDANTSNWASGSSILTINANAKAINGRVDGYVQESRILILIKKGGAKVCGSYTPETAPAANFNTLVKAWSGNSAITLLGQPCTLPPGDYELSVQFFSYSNGKVIPLSEEKTKAFSIRGDEQQVYQQPHALAPANATLFKEIDITKPVTFRWTPLVPKPQEPVIYRLKVWQIMQGQSGTQARTSNQPILTKDIANLTQATISNLITGPCKPPYLCDFVWNVQALNREGKPIGSNNGTSETFIFGISSDKGIIHQQITLVAPANGSTVASNGPLSFKWLPPAPITSGQTHKIKIVEITGDQSPEQALRVNKPFFEKDSSMYLHTNKPFFEKDSTLELTVNEPFTAGKKYAWAVSTTDNKGNLYPGSASIFSIAAAKCDCGKWNLLSQEGKSYDCGSLIKWTCNKPFQFTGVFRCSTENCSSKTTWEISKDRKILKRGSGSGTIKEGFTPTGNGRFTITLNAVCGEKKCAPCVYIIEVNDCKK